MHFLSSRRFVRDSNVLLTACIEFISTSFLDSSKSEKSIACYCRTKNKKKNWNHFFPRAKTLRLNGFLFIWAYKISNVLVSLSQLKLTVDNSNVCELIVATVLRYRCQHNKFDACKTVSSASVTNTIVNQWLSTG